MNIARSMLLVLSGVVAGIGLVLSCGDNLTAKATADAAVTAPDAAAVCDCPAAEPPLANRLVLHDVLRLIDGNQEGATDIFCPVGAQPISGSCTVDGPLSDPRRDVVVKESGFSDKPLAWRCVYRNNESTSVLFRIAVLCLKPAP
jgi:hypothetical protein